MCGAHDPDRSLNRAPPRHPTASELVLHDRESLGVLALGTLGVEDLHAQRRVAGLLLGLDPEGVDHLVALGVPPLREHVIALDDERLARHSDGRVVLRQLLVGITPDGLGTVPRGLLAFQADVHVLRVLHELARRRLVHLRRVALVPRRLVARDVRALVVLRRVVSALGQGVRLGRCLGERVRPHLGLDLDDGLAVELQGEVARRLGLGLGEQLDEHAATRRTTSNSVGSGHAAALAVGVARVGVAPRLGVSGHLLVGLGDSFDVPLELLDELHLAANGVLRRLALRNTDLDLVVADRVTDGAVDPAEALPLGVALPVPAGGALRVVARPERHRPVGLEAVVLLALRRTVCPDAGEDGHLGAQLDAVDGRGAGAARRLRVALAADDVGALASAGTDLHVVTGRRLLVGAADTAGRC